MFLYLFLFCIFPNLILIKINKFEFCRILLFLEYKVVQCVGNVIFDLWTGIFDVEFCTSTIKMYYSFMQKYSFIYSAGIWLKDFRIPNMINTCNEYCVVACYSSGDNLHRGPINPCIVHCQIKIWRGKLRPRRTDSISLIRKVTSVRVVQ